MQSEQPEVFSNHVALGEWFSGFGHDAYNFLTPLGGGAQRIFKKTGNKHAKEISEKSLTFEQKVDKIRLELAQVKVVVTGASKETKEAVYERKMAEIGARFGAKLPELKTLLKQIREPLNALKNAVPKSEEIDVGEYVSDMEKSFASLENVVNDAQNLSCSETKAIARLREVHNAALNLSHPHDRNKIFFNGRNHLVGCSHHDLLRVFRNLYKNAFEAGANKIVVKATKKDDLVTIKIKDNGKGTEHAEKIFNPFFSTKEDGLGVGLAVIKKILEKNNGNINLLKSTPKGTVFALSLRLANKSSTTKGL
jgi:signal transduction histidine kinase